jgi:hemerythrin-like metal-binding protein
MKRMAFMEWNDSLAVHQPAIDADHKRLVELVNRLHDAMMARQGAQTVGGVLNDLIDYTKTHFGREEDLMKTRAYPQYLAHKAEHDKLVQQAIDLQRKFASGAVTITLETMDFLRDWLFNHIMKVDQQLGKWLAANPA